MRGDGLAVLLTRADTLLAAFQSDVAAAGEPGLAMTEIADELDEHIVDEEATVFPVMREFVSAGDFARCEKLFRKEVPFAHVKFLMPWVVAQCTEEERRDLWPQAPLPIRLLVRATAKGWRRRVAVVLG